MKHTGLKFKQYIRRERYRLASNVLKGTNEPIKEIAKQAGYSNVQSFCKFFKEMTGKTPTEYRKGDLK